MLHHKPGVRRTLLASIAVAGLLAACSDNGATDAEGPTSTLGVTAFPSPSATGGLVSPFPSYSPYGFETCEPEHLDYPTWIPGDLPLPQGIYATAMEPETSGYERAFLIIPGDITIPELTRMIVKKWPAAGYQLGRGDSEAGEVEAEFSKPPATGAFKVQATACTNPAYSVMYLIYAPNGPEPLTPTLTPTPSGS
jgi:hypothetical protein